MLVLSLAHEVPTCTWMLPETAVNTATPISLVQRGRGVHTGGQRVEHIIKPRSHFLKLFLILYGYPLLSDGPSSDNPLFQNLSIIFRTHSFNACSFFQFVSKGHNHSPHVVSPGLISKLLPIILLSSCLLFFWLFSPLMSIPSLLSPCLSQWEQLPLLVIFPCIPSSFCSYCFLFTTSICWLLLSPHLAPLLFLLPVLRFSTHPVLIN